MSSSLECNPATLPIEVEPASKEPQLELRNEEVRVQGEDWQDPICKLFATEVNIPLNSNDSVKLVDGELRDEEIQSCEQRQIAAAPPISKYVVGLSMASRFEERVAGFLEMGFSTELIQRAIQLHGAQAEDSTLLQFILDWKKDHAQSRNVDDEAVDNDNDGPEEGLNIAVLAERSPPLHEPNEMNLFKSGSDWESEESDSGESDSDDDDETPCRDPSPIDRDAEATESFKLALCSRPIPSGEGHRHLLLSQGFQSDLIERAIQELGEGVEADMLIEYILYLTSEQEHGASTSEHASTKGISTVEKLVTEFQFPSDVVERAVKVCHTPLWNAEDDQIADVVDFVMAHDGELEEEVEGNSDDECEEDNCWTFVREQIAFDVAAKRGGKRKIGDLDFNAVSERVPIPRIQRIPIGRIKRVPTIRQRKPRVELEVETCVEPLSTGRITRCRVRRPRMRRRLEEKNTPTEKIEKIERNRGERIERHRREKIEKIERHRGEKIEKIERHRGAVGFGLPGEPVQSRYLSEDVKGAPFFYFENVASMPNDEWARIRRHLFDVEPEFVDSLHFSACRRPRGYIHNLPIEGRRKILADPPMTIQELMPQTKIFWPDWDPRTKLNCIKTTKASEFVAKKLQIGDGTELQTAAPSPALQQEILHLCRSWNLVWTGPNTPTPISENEIEAMLGFDPDHSRSCLSTRTRFKALGNSFSVFTVAFHFSVLKPLYPRGIKVLSLFSGIGGAEVALHKLGVKLLVVVSVEIDDGTRRCLDVWWAASKQTGVLNQEFHNVRDLGRTEISTLVNKYRGFDLIVGGSPCNNLSGNNQVSRVGLDGQHSSIFFEFSRIVTAVRELTIRLQQR